MSSVLASVTKPLAHAEVERALEGIHQSFSNSVMVTQGDMLGPGDCDVAVVYRNTSIPRHNQFVFEEGDFGNLEPCLKLEGQTQYSRSAFSRVWSETGSIRRCCIRGDWRDRPLPPVVVESTRLRAIRIRASGPIVESVRACREVVRLFGLADIVRIGDKNGSQLAAEVCSDEWRLNNCGRNFIEIGCDSDEVISNVLMNADWLAELQTPVLVMTGWFGRSEADKWNSDRDKLNSITRDWNCTPRWLRYSRSPFEIDLDGEEWQRYPVLVNSGKDEFQVDVLHSDKGMMLEFQTLGSSQLLSCLAASSGQKTTIWTDDLCGRWRGDDV